MNFNVTGYKGYIGSHLWDLLGELPDLSTGLDRCEPWDVEVNKEQLMIMCAMPCDTFIHLAASVSVPESFEKTSEYVYQNLTLLDSILKKCRTEHFLFISSQTALQPDTPYAMTKYLGELMVQQSGIPYTILRLPNVAGVSPKHALKLKSQYIVGAFCKAAKYGNPAYIYGNDYPTLDGTCIRDYVHVEDIAHIIKEYAFGQPTNSIVYVRSASNTYSNLDLAYKIGEISGKAFAVKPLSRREGDAAEYILPKGAEEQKFIKKKDMKSIDKIIRSVYDVV